MRTKPLAFAVHCAGLAAVACTTFATDSYAADTGTGQQDDIQQWSGAIEEVLVTARRREETLLEVPMSVSAISAGEIASRNAVDATDLYRSLAGAAMPRGQLILRGLSGGNSTAPDTTSTFVDDIPIEFTNLADIERVEVLRGPQGTLYGSNAIGGTVRIVTNKPRLNEFEAFSSVQAGSEKDVSGSDSNISMGINVPLLEDTLALRVSGNRQHDQLPFVNINTGHQSDRDSNFVRSQLLWQIDDNMDATLGYSRIVSKGKGDSLGDRSTPGYYWDYELTENPDAPYGYDVDFFTVDCDPQQERSACLSGGAGDKTPRKYQIWESLDSRFEQTTDLYTLNFNHADLFGLASLTYAGSYRKFREDSLDDWSRLDLYDMAQTWIINEDFYNRTTHEVRLQNLDNSGPLSWTLGAFYDKTETRDAMNLQNQYIRAGDETSAVAMAAWGEDAAQMGRDLFNDPQNIWRYSVPLYYTMEVSQFADVAYALDIGTMGELEFNAGVRHYRLKDFSHDVQAGIWAEMDETSSGSESGNRYKFSTSWRPLDTLSVYALYSEGYRAGGNNGPLSNACVGDEFASTYKPRYESDAIDNYELGLKASALDGRLNFAGAIYHIDWTGMKTDVYMPTCGFSYTANAGEARSRGLEFESTARLTDSLQLVFNAAYTNSELREDNDSIQAKKGDKMTMVPEWNSYLALNRDFQLFGRPANLRIDHSFYGEYKTHFNVRPEDVAPSYNYFNLSGGVDVSERLRLSAYVNNLFDRESVKYKNARVRDEDDTVAQQYIEYLEGRKFVLRADYTFN